MTRVFRPYVWTSACCCRRICASGCPRATWRCSSVTWPRNSIGQPLSRPTRAETVGDLPQEGDVAFLSHPQLPTIARETRAAELPRIHERRLLASHLDRACAHRALRRCVPAASAAKRIGGVPHARASRRGEPARGPLAGAEAGIAGPWRRRLRQRRPGGQDGSGLLGGPTGVQALPPDPVCARSYTTSAKVASIRRK
jgi:hypothetical protein